MKKRIINVILIFILVIIILLGAIYLIDLNRMKNNEPVFFSTWGAEYAPVKKESIQTNAVTLTPRKSDKVEKKDVNDFSGNLSNSIMTVTNSLNGVSSPSEYISNTYTNITEPYNPSNSVIKTPDGVATVPSPENPGAIVTKPSESLEINRTLDKVSMEIKHETLTQTSATIVITDTNETPYSYGTWFRIDRKVDGGWEKLETIRDDVAFNSIAIIPSDDGILQMKEDWTNIYGELKPGEYRFVKDVYEDGRKYIYASFKIEK